MTTENAAAEPVQTAEEEFNAAFAEAVTETPAAVAAKVETAAATPDATPDASAATTEAAAAEEGAAATDTSASEAAQAATEAAETPEARIARLEAENAKLKEPRPAAPATESAAVAATPAATPATPAVPEEPKWYTPSDEEAAALKQFRSEWPDIANAQDVAIKQAGYNVAQYVFNELAKVYNPLLQSLVERTAAFEENMTLSLLHSAHPDYDDIYDKVVGWVETLPTAFRQGAKQVMESGTPDEVNELIATYKQQAGEQAPAVTPAAAPVSVAKQTELSAAAKKAAGKLSVVGSKRTTPVAAPDPTDFDGAWKEALGGG